MCMHAWTVLFFLRFILMGRFCLFSSIFQLPFYTLVFSEWGCFFLLVRLGSGGNTKDFLSLSKKAPPQLSGLLACRYGRRRGLRNSFRSDSPRPFPFVSLASSPPDKGGIGDCALACILTPSVFSTPPSFGHLPYILLCKTPRNAAGHGKGGVWYMSFVTVRCVFYITI